MSAKMQVIDKAISEYKRLRDRKNLLEKKMDILHKLIDVELGNNEQPPLVDGKFEWQPDPYIGSSGIAKRTWKVSRHTSFDLAKEILSKKTYSRVIKETPCNSVTVS